MRGSGHLSQRLLALRKVPVASVPVASVPVASVPVASNKIVLSYSKRNRLLSTYLQWFNS